MSSSSSRLLACLERARARVSRWIWGRQTRNILLLGLDNAGKTTLLHLLRDRIIALHEPTSKPQNAEIPWGESVALNMYDMGGHAAARRIWSQYIKQEIHGVVFVVDASEPNRFAEAADELNTVMTDPRLEHAIFLILGNKTDLLSATDEQTLREALGVPCFDGPASHTKLAMSSVTHRAGIDSAVAWFASRVARV